MFWIAKSVSTLLGLISGISNTRHFIDGRRLVFTLVIDSYVYFMGDRWFPKSLISACRNGHVRLFLESAFFQEKPSSGMNF